VLARVALDLRAVERYVAELDEAGFLAEHQDLLEQVGKRRDVRLPKGVDAREVRMLAPRQDAEAHILDGRLRDLPRREDADAVRVGEQRHHHRGVVGPLAARVFGLDRVLDLAQVEELDDIQDEVDEVTLREPVAGGGREEEVLVIGGPAFVSLDTHGASRSCGPPCVDPPNARKTQQKRMYVPTSPGPATSLTPSGGPFPRKAPVDRLNCRDGDRTWSTRRGSALDGGTGPR